MEKIIINGGNPINGSISISGMKNSVLPIIYACLLIPHECIIKNVPRVSDVYNSLALLRSMGAKAEFCGPHEVRINTQNATNVIGTPGLVCQMRASSYLMGAMLSRFGGAELPLPGGCNFGARPIDLHIKGFENLGAECVEEDGIIRIKSQKTRESKKITLDKISVGATINMVLASATFDGTTIIKNCAREPHIDDLIHFLNSCGARITRVDSTIICRGVKKLYGTSYSIYPDMIEALTYICCVGICKGEILLENIVTEHLSNELEIFKNMGYIFKEYGDKLTVFAEDIKGVHVETAPYPLFPTDLHPQFASLLCFANDGGSVRDNVFPTRFAYVEELKKMGARINKCGNIVFVEKSLLHGGIIDATDLRAGAALVLAALGADGQSTINNVNYIVRGYESIVEKLSSVGGKIKLIKGE